MEIDENLRANLRAALFGSFCLVSFTLPSSVLRLKLKFLWIPFGVIGNGFMKRKSKNAKWHFNVLLLPAEWETCVRFDLEKLFSLMLT